MKKGSEKTRLHTVAVGLPIVVYILLLDRWLPFRTYVAVCMLVLLVSAIILPLCFRRVEGRRKSRLVSALDKASGIALMAGGMALLEIIRLLRRYGYASGRLFPFWKTAMAVAILSAIVFVIWILGKYKRKEEARRPSAAQKNGTDHRLSWWQILLFAILIAILVGFLLYALLVHTNLLLDPAEPQSMTAEVVDRDYDSGGRRLPASYSFEIVVDGQPVNLPVSSDEYHHGKVGDVVWFYRYEGALGVPFYVSETLLE